jgi:predicted NAD/FAD-binding protein
MLVPRIYGQQEIPLRIAIVGAGIAGLGSAYLLARRGHSVTLFEANDYLGGHTHTVDVSLDGTTAPVDTGFLVFNDRTYPRLIALLDELGVQSTESEMSFSVRVESIGLEWAGTDLPALFAQPRNAMRPAFWSMLADILRFNRETMRLHAAGAIPTITLGNFLDAGRYSSAFRDWYLLPMAAAIWSAPQERIRQFPLRSFIHFCRNHGLLQIRDRPQWRTVVGGGRAYVAKIAARLAQAGADVRSNTPVTAVRRHATGVQVSAAGRTEEFDALILACHSDQCLRLLADADPQESRLLAAVAYQSNEVILHTDARFLPRARRAWSAWNYLAAGTAQGKGASDAPVAVSYLINKLQPLPFRTPVIVSLNPPFAPDPSKVLQRFEYSHPLLDEAAVAAQQDIARLQGRRHTWFAGAWLGYGFHEDGLASAHAIADALRVPLAADAATVAPLAPLEGATPITPPAPVTAAARAA